MPKSIHELPENVVHKIAAGEVVERPVSVVKELVENALDAGATQIHVDVRKGGIDSITITDNGHGIPAQELPLALKRHATSKLENAEDLFALATLGFRGEALPSIASVSDFRIESATAESDPVGYVLEVKEGKKSALKETPMTRGTRVVVQNLFCTTPARLKFLKRPETEWSHIADLITALALSRLEIEWRVDHNGKNFLFCPPANDAKQRILDLFGKEAMENLYPVDRQVSEIGLAGLISHPNFSKKTNRHMFVFVNGRYVQDRILNHAIVTGYRSLLMTQQYPMVVLYLNIAPALVDVNVHPTKREVKFANSNAIHHLVSETLHQALEQAPWRENAAPTEISSSSQQAGSLFPDAKPEGQVYQGGVPRPPQTELNSDQAKQRVQTALEDYAARNLHWETPSASEPTTPQAKIGTLAFGSLQLIGQFQSTYLVCEQEGSLILIDQHAAHERIGFEKFKADFQKDGLSQQTLLHPISFELPSDESERLRSCLEDLEKFGLVVDEFGEKTFVIKAHPTLIAKGDWVALVREVAEKMQSTARTQPLEERLDHVLATMACHRQIRANHRLTREEMSALLQQLEGTPRSYHCPHGRPVMVEIEAREIEKWFKRVL